MNRDHATALQPGVQEENSVSKKEKERKRGIVEIHEDSRGKEERSGERKGEFCREQNGEVVSSVGVKGMGAPWLVTERWTGGRIDW